MGKSSLKMVKTSYLKFKEVIKIKNIVSLIKNGVSVIKNGCSLKS